MIFERHQLTSLLRWPLLTAGAGALLLSLFSLPAAASDLSFLLLTLITLSLGTRLVFKVPHTGAYVCLADSLTILSLFLFDGPRAVMLAALSAFCVSLRLTRRASTLLFASALASLAMYLSAATLTSLFGPVPELARSAPATTFVLSLVLVALLHTAVSACVNSFSVEAGTTRARSRHLLSTLLIYLSLASLAGLAAQLAVFGQLPFLASLTLVAVAHFCHGVYIRNVQTSSAPSVELERSLQFARGSEEIFRSAFDYAAIGMALVSPGGKWLQVNRSLCEILGYTEAELLEKSFQDVTHPDDVGPTLANIKNLIKGKTQSYQAEKRYVRKGGEIVWGLWNAARIVESETNAMRIIFQVQDITERKLSEQRLMHDAFHDALTGLPNRALLIDHIKLTISRSKRREGHLFAVLFLDLDRFKVINDSLGHMIGDQLLVGVARRLESCLRDGDTVARVGGDEFTILLEDIEQETEAVSVAERIEKEMSAPFHLSGHEVFTTVSVGIAPSTTGYEDPEDILRDADTAMYRAKSLGKARHEVFDKAMHAFAVNLLQLETDLRKALDRREFYMLYQPIVALDDFQLCGFEALVRWQHPERGLISPMDFIPVAEDTGQIVAIGEWALLEACRQMRRWQKQFPSDAPLFISVNLSSKQFMQPNLIEQVRTIIEKTKLNPRSLKLEITESAVMENIDTTTEMLRQLRELGVQLSIDDFGTGYSSLSYLHRFPIDTLKIDRSFVTRMVDNSENIEIVRTIIMLAQVLGMDVVAEGVETKEQLALLRKLGCENGQGYYFSRPTSTTEAEKIISDTYARPQSSTPKGTASNPAVLTDDKVKTFRLMPGA
jgi:diguanylate cyclase (GGDEF)-like protein/PAS domain S-box-containing protein